MLHRERKDQPGNAFTRIELAAVLAAIFFVMGFIVVPAMATTKADSGRITCFNNLRGIGRAVQVWANDHHRQFSWRSYPPQDGGSTTQLRPAAAWFEYSVLSNELVTPRILACPSDAGVKRAEIFAYEDEGLLRQGYQNNAVSYPLNLDGSLDVPRSWLSGDRNIDAGSYQDFQCSAGVQGPMAIPLGAQPVMRWTNAVHGLFGHMATTDGTVEFTSGDRMREIILQQGIDDGGKIHFLKAR